MEYSKLGHFEYVGILSDIFSDIVQPILCNACTFALNQKHGDAGIVRAQKILESYEDWENIKSTWYFDGNIRIDMTGIMYLIFPKENCDSPGIIKEITEIYSLSDKQVNRIKYLRRLRNNVAHCYPIQIDRDGHLEKEAMQQIVNALSIFDVTIDSKLDKYRDELNVKIEQRKNEDPQYRADYEKQVRLNMVMAQIQSEREQYKVFARLEGCEWYHAPIGLPLENEAPWGSANFELNDLPWPVIEEPTINPTPIIQTQPLTKEEIQRQKEEQPKMPKLPPIPNQQNIKEQMVDGIVQENKEVVDLKEQGMSFAKEVIKQADNFAGGQNVDTEQLKEQGKVIAKEVGKQAEKAATEFAKDVKTGFNVLKKWMKK